MGIFVTKWARLTTIAAQPWLRLTGTWPGGWKPTGKRLPREALTEDHLATCLPWTSGTFTPQRDGRSTWHRYLDGLPQGCLLLLVGSSPCQDLTRASTHQGLNGPVGPRSVHF